MKFILYTSIVFITIACSNQSNFKEKYYDCLVRSNSIDGFDTKKEIEKLESELLKKGYLKDTTCNGYIDFLVNYSDSIIKVEGLNKLPNDSFSFKTNNCFKNDTISKYYQFINAYNKVLFSKKDKNILNKVFNEKEFDRDPYYKTVVLLTTYFQIQARNGLSKKTENKESDEDSTVDIIILKQGNIILFNNVSCDIKDLRPKLIEKKRVFVGVEGNTTYEQLNKIIDTLDVLKIEY